MLEALGLTGSRKTDLSYPPLISINDLLSVTWVRLTFDASLRCFLPPALRLVLFRLLWHYYFLPLRGSFHLSSLSDFPFSITSLCYILFSFQLLLLIYILSDCMPHRQSEAWIPAYIGFKHTLQTFTSPNGVSLTYLCPQQIKATQVLCTYNMTWFPFMLHYSIT